MYYKTHFTETYIVADISWAFVRHIKSIQHSFCAGCKWSLQQLRCYLQQTVGSDWLLWQNISTMIVLTIVSQLSKVPNTVNCFEFYGFDILIDSDLKPWLIEVNKR